MITNNPIPSQLGGKLFLTDSGLETTLVFHEGRDLPCFAAFDLHRETEGEAWLRDYFDRHAAIAAEMGFGFVFETATWRASPDWGRLLGYEEAAIAAVNRRAVCFLRETAARWARRMQVVVSGCIGPRGDGYDPGRAMSVAEAEAYHGLQARAFADAGADLATAITMTSAAEAAGVARAALGAGLPVAVSFTVETDGALPSGQPLGEAIAMVDAATDGRVAYYMLNCAHPSHFAETLGRGERWTRRIRGLRANASTKSHAELDGATELDAGDPEALGADYADLLAKMPWLTVLGGCCGTDHRHIRAIGRACGRAANALASSSRKGEAPCRP